MTKHFHTIEAAFVGGLGALVLFHTLRYVGAKLAKSSTAGVSKTGRALAGAATFGSP